MKNATSSWPRVLLMVCSLGMALVAVAGAPWPIRELAEQPAAPSFDSPGVVPEHSVARLWNEQLLDAIRKDRPKPPVHARNLFHLSVAMWDAWAAYDPLAQGHVFTEKIVLPPADPASGDDEGDDEGDDDGGDSDGDDGGDDDSSDDDGGPEVKLYDPAVEAARAEAISFAAYRLLRYRFPGTGFVDDGSGNLNPCQPGALTSLADFDAQMDALGYDKTFTSTVGDSPAAVGNRVAQAVIAYGVADGANEDPHHCYPDDSGYFPFNPSLPIKLPGTEMYDPNHWQPLAFDLLILQNGIIIGAAEQTFIGVAWADVEPFGLTPADLGNPNPVNCLPHPTAQGLPYLDPGCPPQLGGVGDETVKAAILEVLRFESWMDPNEGVMIDISPGAIGNNPLGTDSGTGHPLNPATGQPYPPNVVNRADAVRIIAEFWADGPASETPPGHWNTLGNYVSDHSLLGPKRVGATGPVVNDLEWDVKLYLALNGATHDAAVTAWGIKHYYDSSRPLSLVRYMCQLGQSSDPGGPSYHPDGVPLEPGLTAVITEASVQPGGEFEHLKAFCAGGGPVTNTGEPCDQLDPDTDDSQCPDDGPFDGYCQSSVGMIATRAWNGSPPNPATELGGVSWRRCIDWIPFQKSTFVTPPFPGYTSGHSTFSRAAAEVLAAFTGTPFFPGGLGTFTALQNEYLSFEEGPTQDVELQWATYFDASDQAAISRRMGSIHPWYDDLPARVMAAQIGTKAWARAQLLYDPTSGGGGAATPDPAAESAPAGGYAALDAGPAAAASQPGGGAASEPAPEEPSAPTRRAARRGSAGLSPRASSR
jgi:hypothetical protein